MLDQYLIEQGVPLSELYEKSGYTPPAMPPLPSPKDEHYPVSYPTDQEYVNQVGGHFHVIKKLHGSHRLSHRTPIFVLARR